MDERIQKDSLNRLIQSIERCKGYLDQRLYFIDYTEVPRAKFLAALRQEGAHKLPFAYSRKSKCYYLLTEKYLKENNKRV